MKAMRIFSLLAIVVLVPCLSGAVSEEDFKVRTTENLLNLCTAAPQDPLFSQAINFCHGFLVGAFHYHEASVSGPGSRRFVCPPDPRPTRDEVISMFIEWVKQHPEYWGEPAVETEFRFLSEQWPCPE